MTEELAGTKWQEGKPPRQGLYKARFRDGSQGIAWWHKTPAWGHWVARVMDSKELGLHASISPEYWAPIIWPEDGAKPDETQPGWDEPKEQAPDDAALLSRPEPEEIGESLEALGYVAFEEDSNRTGTWTYTEPQEVWLKMNICNDYTERWRVVAVVEDDPVYSTAGHRSPREAIDEAWEAAYQVSKVRE